MGGDGKKFLKTRAPFYLAGVTILAVFIIPNMLAVELRDIIPETLSPDEMEVLQSVFDYTGPNDTGINVYEAISERVVERYPDGNVYEHHSTILHAIVTNTGGGLYRVVLDFESQSDELYFDMNINVTDGEVTGNNNLSKDVIDLVYYYD
ncbi:MAG: hypothetical protein F4W68_00345 [Cenarchaeum sp. SB0661_bin_35]|nr:hypothetical protein [Cenarchaeum sp. SB0662_bin_33]MYC78949.1 hypothetical protein [Cenarchaeum sp. SB0661_bin_35]MYI51819.1 hypothetical protein [Cenarchaeum sp. SB0673_bin_9]